MSKKQRKRKVTVTEIKQALRGIEEWCRSLREVLECMDKDACVTVPETMFRQSNGTDPLAYGCPALPPCEPEEEEQEDESCEEQGKAS